MNPSDDTIAAIATPLGEGGLGIIRISGPKALSVADQIFRSKKRPLKKAPSHTLHLGWIENGTEKIDQVVVSVFRAPQSYTGEDLIEISCHGSPLVLKEILAICVDKGARLAGPGEFTQRAYLNGKLDLLQAEAVAELIRATSKRGREIASWHLQGNLSLRLGKIRARLVDFLAHLEANLDFVEEDIPGLGRSEMEDRLKEGLQELEKLLATSLRGNLIREGIRLALIGRANVGKSSLFNALLLQERAIVTDIPGTTRDVLEERLQWDGMTVVISDTAGFKEGGSELDKMGIDRARKTHALAQVILFVLDGSQPISKEEVALSKEFQGKEVVVVLNKMDKGLKVNRAEVKKLLGSDKVVETSAMEGTGLSGIKELVVQSFRRMVPEVEDGFVFLNLRHIAHLEKALVNLKSALNSIKEGRSEEALAVDLRKSIEELGAITGENVAKDVLDSIFSQFCIGK